MRKIKGEIERVGLSCYELRIRDTEAMEKLLKNKWTGFDIQDVLATANHTLKTIGVVVEV